MSLKKIFVNKDISIAKTMPSQYYLNDSYFNLTLKNIFEKSWQFVIDKSRISTGIYPFNFLKDSINEPFILINNVDETLCLSNVCTHRGNLLCTKKSNQKSIKCSYHGRTFDLKGKIKKYPGFENVKNFPTKSDNLTKLETLIWKNFIFSSIYKPQYNFKNTFNDIENRLGWYPFEKLEYDKQNSNSWVIDANWALYCENYLEGFHVPFIHKGLNSDIKYDTYKTILLDHSVLQFTQSKKNKDQLNIPKGYNDYNKNIYAYYYWLYPNMMFNFYPWGLSINIIEPISKDKTKINFLSYPISSKKQPQNNNSDLTKVELEDQKVVLNVQNGIKSKFYNQGRYSTKHEKGVHYFHQLLCNYLN